MRAKFLPGVLLFPRCHYFLFLKEMFDNESDVSWNASMTDREQEVEFAEDCEVASGAWDTEVGEP